MSSLLENVDSRTRLVGENRLELLMFRLHGRQLYAINVFKVQEVLMLPKYSILPSSDPSVVGVIHQRGQTISVINLAQAVGMRPIKPTEDSALIVTEYNSSVQAFLVGGVERIINLNWADILPPPTGSGRENYLTAITNMDNQIVEIIDVEKVLDEITKIRVNIDVENLDQRVVDEAKKMQILMVDDSNTAIRQVQQTLSALDITIHTAGDGKSALKLLKDWADEGIDVPNKLLMVITDAEMPEMDGYKLTQEIREDSRLKDLFVALHTSLSGKFNHAMMEKVGCDAFLSKFHHKELNDIVIERIKSVSGIEINEEAPTLEDGSA